MNAKLCLLVFLFAVSNVYPQPMVVVWEREMTYVNDTLRGLRSYDVIEESPSHSLFITGSSNSSPVQSGDSSDAFVIKLSASGDSLWTQFYDDEDGYLFHFGPLTQLTSGQFAVGAYHHSLFVLDQDGNAQNVNSHQCDAYSAGIEVITSFPDGRIVSGSGCMFNWDLFIETAVITCVAENGDSLWTVTREYSDFNHVRKLIPLESGNLLAIIEYEYQPFGSYALTIDPVGNVLSEYWHPDRIQDALPISPDTIVYTECEGGWGTLVMRKMTSNNELVDEILFPSVDCDTRIFSTTQGNIRLITNRGLVMELDANFESLWSQQLSIQQANNAILLADDGMLILDNIVLPDNGQRAVRVLRTSAPFPRLAVSTDHIDFGRTEPHEAVIRTLELTDAGPDSVLVETMSFPTGFSGDLVAPFWVYFGISTFLEIAFDPNDPVEYSGSLVIETATPFEPIEVSLWGSAVPADARENPLLISTYSLMPPFPNPFNATTTFEFIIPQPGIVRLDIYDISGRVVAKLLDGSIASGQHSVTWSCAECASGIYFATMTAGPFTATQKLLLLK